MAPISIEINGFSHTADNSTVGLKLKDSRVAILLVDNQDISKAVIAERGDSELPIKLIDRVVLDKNGLQSFKRDIQYRDINNEPRIVHAKFTNEPKHN